MNLEIEWPDGSSGAYSVKTSAEAWLVVKSLESDEHQIMSAWIDDEPWFGVCTHDLNHDE